MIPNNMWPKNVIHAYHLRATATREHGSKDWICVLSSNPPYNGKLWAIFGKTDEVMSGGGQGCSRSKDPATEEALKEAVRAKLNGKDSYVIIDEYEARCGWHNQPSSRVAVPQQPSAPPPTAPKAARTPKATAPKQPLKNLVEGTEESEPTMCW